LILCDNALVAATHTSGAVRPPLWLALNRAHWLLKAVDFRGPFDSSDGYSY